MATEEILKELENCRFCPHDCGVNRFAGPHGYCRSGAGFYISSIVIHRGEEPVISGDDGICNVFFSHCNLQCSFCQNYQISSNKNSASADEMSFDNVISSITSILDRGIENLGFVSPSHMVPQVKAIIKRLNDEGYHPVIVYNTNAYDSVSTLRSLEGIVDVYLPDMKYDDPDISKRWSGAYDYPEIARRAIKEMYRQMGNVLHLNEKGKLTRGMVVRHLVMPGAVENSLKVLGFLADEISNSIAVSLMAQYNPNPYCLTPPLSRKLRKHEYSMVVDEFHRLGFEKGWVQELESADHYNPDFRRQSPFE